MREKFLEKHNNFCLSGFAISLWNVRNFLSLILEISFSRSIRHFFRVESLYFFVLETSFLKYFILKTKKLSFRKYKKNFFLENIRTLRFPKDKKSCFWKSIRNFFRADFFRKKYKFFLGKIMKVKAGEWPRSMQIILLRTSS